MPVRASDWIGLGRSPSGGLNDSDAQTRANHRLQDQLSPSRLVAVGCEQVVSVGFISLQLINSCFRCLEKLQPAYQVTFPGQEPIVKKGKICPIDITLAQRASNKKVILKRQCLKRVIECPCWVLVSHVTGGGRWASETSEGIYAAPVFMRWLWALYKRVSWPPCSLPSGILC